MNGDLSKVFSDVKKAALPRTSAKSGVDRRRVEKFDSTKERTTGRNKKERKLTRRPSFRSDQWTLAKLRRMSATSSWREMSEQMEEEPSLSP